MESARKTSLHILVTVVVSFARVCVVPSASNGMPRFRPALRTADYLAPNRR